MPESLRKLKDFINEPEEINFMIFFRMMQHFIDEEKMKSLFKRRKNLLKMLENLQKNLS